jgi:selenide,water dikinase
VGILSAALKKGKLNAEGYRQMIDTTTQLNRVGATLGGMSSVHAMTDVTGFALLGHLLEVCRGSKLGAEVDFNALPVLSEALSLAEQGYATGAADRNWNSYGMEVDLPQGFPEWQRKLLCDPQTSGGLLVACSANQVAKVLATFHEQDFAAACVIGKMVAGEARVRVV